MDRQPLELGQLPVGILAEIVHHVDREKDLLSLCRVSRLFNQLAERDLYANVHVRMGRNATRFRLAVRSRPERPKFVRNAWLHSMHPSRLSGFWTSCMLCSLLAACQNLETLELASNDAHQSDTMDMDTDTLYDDLLYYQHDLHDMLCRISLHPPPSERVLPALTTLRLHFQTLGYIPEWELGSTLMHIFLSPTLRGISLVRCLLIQHDSALLESMQLDQFTCATPLETLRRWHCIPSADVLQRIFAPPPPRHLKCVHLEPYLGSRPSIIQSETFRDLDAWTDVFIQQKSSPQYYRMLDETCPTWDQWTEVDGESLRFERLERQKFQYDITRHLELDRIHEISDLDDMLFGDDFDGMYEDDWM